MNTKRISVFVPNENIFRRIKTTPAISNILGTNLKVGNNTMTVNHYQYSEIQRMANVIRIIVEEI